MEVGLLPEPLMFGFGGESVFPLEAAMKWQREIVPSAPGFYPHGGFPGRLRFHDFLRILMSCGFKLPQNFYGSGFHRSMA